MIYHIDILGNDDNIGTSQSTAWRTLAKGNERLASGDTALIYPGTYLDPIAPTQDSITYEGIGKPVITGPAELLINLHNRSSVTVQGFEFVEPTGAWGEIKNGNYNKIIGNKFSATKATPNYGGLYLYTLEEKDKPKGTCLYNEIRGNEFLNWGVPTEKQEGDAVRLSRFADWTIIENNRFVNAGHDLLGVDTSFNVIRGNYFENTWQKGLNIVHRVNPPWLDYQVTWPAQRNLIERNIFARSRYGLPGIQGGVGMQLAGMENIVRNNVFMDNANAGLYLNGWGDAPVPKRNRIYGNRFYYNKEAIVVTDFGLASVEIGENVFGENETFGEPLNVSVKAGMEPTVRTGSPVTAQNGRGKRLVVDDAMWFIAGDSVTIGDSKPVTVVSVDTAANVMTLAEARTWRKGNAINLN